MKSSSERCCWLVHLATTRNCQESRKGIIHSRLQTTLLKRKNPLFGEKYLSRILVPRVIAYEHPKTSIYLWYIPKIWCLYVACNLLQLLLPGTLLNPPWSEWPYLQPGNLAWMTGVCSRKMRFHSRMALCLLETTRRITGIIGNFRATFQAFSSQHFSHKTIYPFECESLLHAWNPRKKYSNFSRRTWPSPWPYLCNWLQHLFTCHVLLFFFQTCFKSFLEGGMFCISQTTFLALPPFPRHLFIVEHGGNSNARQSHRSAPHRRSASVRVVEFL